MGILDSLSLGFSVSLAPINLFYCFIGVLFGTLVGVLPGLGSAGAIALLLPITYGMSATSAIIMLAGIWYGSMYGGSTTSILLRIPGESASVMTCIDGFEMARRGRAGAALGIAAFGSFIAGMLGLVGLALLAPPLAEFALDFGPPEYFALTVLGLTLVSYLGSELGIEGARHGGLGLLLGTVGLDPVRSEERFTFGTLSLQSGIELGSDGDGSVRPRRRSAACLCRRFHACRNRSMRRAACAASAGPARMAQRDRCNCRGSLIGFLVGLLPGAGATISSFAAYAVEKRISAHPERFGQARSKAWRPRNQPTMRRRQRLHSAAHAGLPANA